MNWTNKDLKDRDKLDKKSHDMLVWIELLYGSIMKPYQLKGFDSIKDRPEICFIHTGKKDNFHYAIFKQDFFDTYEISIWVRVEEWEFRDVLNNNDLTYKPIDLIECTLKFRIWILNTERHYYHFPDLKTFTNFLIDKDIYKKVILKLEKEAVLRM